MRSALVGTQEILKALEGGSQHEGHLFIELRYVVKPEISANYRQAKNSQRDLTDRVRLGSRLFIRDTLANLRSRGVVVRESDGIWRLSDAYKCIPDKYKGTPKAGVFMKGWLAAKNEKEIPKYKAIHFTEVCEEGYIAGQPSHLNDEMTKKAKQKQNSLTLVVKKNLVALAEGINEQHQLCKQSVRTTLEHAVKAGELLEKVKREVEHGDWGQWIADNCNLSSRTAQFYMKVSRKKRQLKNEMISHLNLSSAIKLLQKPKKKKKLIQKKKKKKTSKLPGDEVDALRALSTSLTTAPQLITQIEGEKGKSYWLETNTDLQKYITRINQKAKTLATILKDRFK